MSSYMPSMRWPSMMTRSRSTETATDESLDQLPAHEVTALSNLRTSSVNVIEELSGTLPQSDVWRLLNNSERSRLRDEILLRFLRYNGLSVDKALRQFRTAFEWRAQSTVATVNKSAMMGKSAGIPVTVAIDPLENGDTLFFCLAEAYIRRDVDHALQGVGVSKMFDHLLYDDTGPHVKRAFVVVDFTNMAMRNVDLVGLKAGIMTYLHYYPDVFFRILLINYPKFIYGVWKAVAPLLDARTVSRVVWLSTGESLREEILPVFGSDRVPVWLGGQAENSQLTLFNDFDVDTSDVATRFV